MKKQLHPGLFEEGRRNSLGMGFEPVAGGEQIELASLQWAAEVKRLERKFEATKNEVLTRLDEGLKSSKVSHETQTGRIQSLEVRMENLAHELRSKLQSLSGKVSEAHMSDLKTQALMDRHTQLLRQFEARVTQLQKVIEDQEFQILGYQASLEEARRELSKLKKL